MKDKNTELVEVIDINNYKKVISKCNIEIGDLVLTSFCVEVVPSRSKYSIELNGKHIITDETSRYLNHSCAPNCKLVPNEHDAFDFIAIKKIERGEELTFNYHQTESEIVGFKDCYCGANNCIKKMGTQIL